MRRNRYTATRMFLAIVMVFGLLFIAMFMITEITFVKVMVLAVISIALTGWLLGGGRRRRDDRRDERSDDREDRRENHPDRRTGT